MAGAKSGVSLNVRDFGALSLDDLEGIVSSSDFYRISEEERRAVAAEVQRRYDGFRKGRGAGEIAADALARGAQQTRDNVASALSLLLPPETRDTALAGFAEQARQRKIDVPRYVEGGVLDTERGPFSSLGIFGAFALESALEQAAQSGGVAAARRGGRHGSARGWRGTGGGGQRRARGGHPRQSGDEHRRKRAVAL